MQSQLNNLSIAASTLDLHVNLDTSNAVVCYTGGFVGARECCTYNSIVMHVVNVYKYLGLLFSTKPSMPTVTHLSVLLVSSVETTVSCQSETVTTRRAVKT